ncbi:MAG: hypothetical protein K8J31_02820, partial [Anaerolineae bacterium]|nr:hypothetical protein [Anaerolineae bacterium]
MSKLRRWQMSASQPFSLLLAADARLRPTDYTDDQVWRLSPGSGGAPALALQTTYGERVGLASLIPLWSHDGRMIYETQAYAKPPVIAAFAPGYLRLQATLTPQIALQSEYWSIDSHTLGGQFTLANSRSEPAQVRLDLFGHVGAQGEEQPLTIVPLDTGIHALYLGKIGNIHPILLLENGTAEMVGGQPVSPKIGCDLTLNSRKRVTIRWVHAGLPQVKDSIAQAQHWLGQDWAPYFKQIEQAANFIPDIETGDDDLDSTLAAAFHDLTLAFLRPTGSLPHASIVAQREPSTGFSRQRDGSDYPRTWSGQTPTLSYLVGLGMASVDPVLAQGLVRNYVAVQQDDGSIDSRPGLGGQRQGLLCMPLLARLSWG